VEFSVLLSGSVVFDSLLGRAVLEADRWLVTADTFCALVNATSPDIASC
jgi:hypothetical protein